MRIGVDLIEIERLVRTIERRPSFLDRVYTERELQMAATLQGHRRNEFLAGRFAAKEAVVKALRLTLQGGRALRGIEILKNPSGAPELHLHGCARHAAETANVGTHDISITHDKGKAIAFAAFLIDDQPEKM